MATQTPASTVAAAVPAAQDILPRPEPAFKGVIGLKAKESRPDFPKTITAPHGAPNVLLILTDDTGFGASSTFGGPIPTATLERVYQQGLCYNGFHTTALCSPTRAALLTGRNHHSVGFGNISEFATGYPGYNSILPKSAGTVGNILVGNGYNTSWFGKNHLIPDWLESPDGPFDQWPSGLGFEYFYGFLGGDTDNWHPALFENTRPVLPPVGDPNYILIRDMTDRAINWIRTQHAVAPDKPFFMYFAPGNGHAPHHATKDWIAKFKGKFDQGWDRQRETTLANQKKLGIVPADTVLTPRPKDIPAWDSLNADQKKVYAALMENSVVGFIPQQLPHHDPKPIRCHGSDLILRRAITGMCMRCTSLLYLIVLYLSDTSAILFVWFMIHPAQYLLRHAPSTAMDAAA